MVRKQRVALRDGHVYTAMRLLPEKQRAQAHARIDEVADLEIVVAAVMADVRDFLDEREVVARLDIGARNPKVEVLADEEADRSSWIFRPGAA